ncbi:MAG: hypothetical protein RLZZ156_453 [Deinococcota bacterium]|jgi:hypothetical protein
MKPDVPSDHKARDWLTQIDQSSSWLPLGAFLLALLFTPLGTLWWLWLLVIGGLFVAQRLKPSTAVLWAVVTVAGGILTAGAWNPRTFSPALRNEPNDLQTLDWSGVQRLEIRGFNGNLRVQVRESGGDLRLERKGGGSVVLEKRGDTLRLVARKPFFSFSSGVNMVLDIPPNLVLNLQTSNGGVRVEGLTREVLAKTSNGRIELRDTGKTKANLETSNGEVVLERVSGDLMAKTSNAKIRVLQGLEVRLGLQTSNANVQLEDLSLQNNTSSSIESSNGMVQLERIRASSGLTIRGNTNNSRVEVDLPGFEVRLEDQRFEALKTGFGMAVLEVRTSNERIVVR